MSAFFGTAEWCELDPDFRPEQIDELTFRRLAGVVSEWLECYGWRPPRTLGGTLFIWEAPMFAGRFRFRIPAVVLDRRNPAEVRVLLEDGSDVSCRNPVELLTELDKLHKRRHVGEPDFQLLGKGLAQYVLYGCVPLERESKRIGVT